MDSTSGRKPGRGGRRPGAGAPPGNLNALKNGEYSTMVQRLIQALATHPTSREVLIRMARRQRARKREAERQATLLLRQLLIRCLLSLGDNQTEQQAAGTNAVMSAILSGKQSKIEPVAQDQSKRP